MHASSRSSLTKAGSNLRRWGSNAKPIAVQLAGSKVNRRRNAMRDDLPSRVRCRRLGALAVAFGPQSASTLSQCLLRGADSVLAHFRFGSKSVICLGQGFTPPFIERPGQFNQAGQQFPERRSVIFEIRRLGNYPFNTRSMSSRLPKSRHADATAERLGH